MSPEHSSVTVLLPRAGESWDMILSRVEREKQPKGKVILCLPPKDAELAADPALRTKIIAKLAEKKGHLILAVKHPTVVADAKAKGIHVVDRLRQLRTLLKDHPQLDDVVRVFSPHYWRQELKTRLQRMGLLALPTLRIYALVGVSALLFFFVVLRLLPSADIRVWPRQEPVTQTINIFLVASGSTVALPPKVQKLPLQSLRVALSHTLTFTDISKIFTGTSAKLPMTVINKSAEQYGLKKGTRFVNQAGMVFLIDRAVIVDPGKQETVPATAADLDLYQKIIGDRGNVPAGLQWEIPGLSEQTRPLVYGVNAAAGKGGTTSYRTVLRQQDIDIAKKRLEQELLVAAQQEIEESRKQLSEDGQGATMVFLPSCDRRLGCIPPPKTQYQTGELSRIFYSDFHLSQEFLGQQVTSIPVDGKIAYRGFVYDENALLELLKQELLSHVQQGKQVVRSSLDTDHLDVRIITYSEDLSWIKLTVELTGTQQYILDPLSVDGAIFSKNARELVAGKNKDESLRVLRNLPEVDRVEISIWPPWTRQLPQIGASISITPQ